MLGITHDLARAFAYSPINAHGRDKDIRLLLIDPVRTESDILSCHMYYRSTTERHFSIEWADYVTEISRPIAPTDRLYWRKERPGVLRYTWGDYYALSYTWGSPTDTETILVDDAPIQVTRNLATALRALREQNFLSEGYHVWCDALCINQLDVTERGREVGRMQVIYTRALETVVYLGHGNPAVENAIAFINVLQGCWDDPTKMHRAVSDYLQVTSPNIWEDIVELNALPYWWRQWVMQEMAAGSGEKPMLYGKALTRSNDIWQVFKDFNRRNRNQAPSSVAFWDAVESFPQHQDKILEVQPFERPNPIGIRKFTFADDGREKWNTYQILSTARKNKCTDPRDEVYGLLGLLDESLASKVKVDYESDHQNVYEAFVRTVVGSERSLEILGQCDIYGTPTWTPRFNQNYPWYKHPYHEQESPMSAHAGRKAEVRFDMQSSEEEPHRLYTRAILFDEVDGLATANLEVDFNDENQLYKGGYAETMVQSTHSNNAYGSEQALKNAIWRTAGGNRDVTGAVPCPPGYAILLSTELLNDTYHFNPFTLPDDTAPNPWAGWVQRNADFKIAGKPLVEYFSPANLQSMTEETRQRGIKLGMDASKRFTNACWSRRIAVTNRGYICSTPWYAEKGDCVAVLPGCSFPILLRSVKDDPANCKAFKIVCPCYCHGVMNGEVWSKVDDGEAELEDIVLL